MKKTFCRAICLVIALLMMFGVCMSQDVHAQTYLCDCNIRWNYLTSGKYYGKVNYSTLNSTYSSTMATCISNWNNSSYNNGVVSISTVSVSNSNIDVLTYANSWPLSSSIYALTLHQFTDYTWHRPGVSSSLFSEYTPSHSCSLGKKYARYAAVVVSNSTPSFMTVANNRKYVFSHEIGHVFGLTHAPGETIMNTATNDIVTSIPTEKDFNGLRMDISNY